MTTRCVARSGSFMRTRLGKLVIDLLGEHIQAVVATKESPTIAEDVRELLFNVGQHFCPKGNPVIGEHWIEFRCWDYHSSSGRLIIRCNFQTILSPVSNHVFIGGKGLNL